MTSRHGVGCSAPGSRTNARHCFGTSEPSMQQETEWLNEVLGLEEDDTGTGIATEVKREAYTYFMRPEPHGEMGPIETGLDVFTGREMRWRSMLVGMTRNAKSKAERRVYLDPLPHIRIDKAKPLQG